MSKEQKDLQKKQSNEETTNENTNNVTDTSETQQTDSTPATPSGRKKIKLEPGKKYRGAFWLNEYGVIEVCASEEGTNPTGKKLVTEDKSKNGGYSIYESKNRVAIHVSLEKSQPGNMKRQLSIIMSAVMFKLQDYFFK